MQVMQNFLHILYFHNLLENLPLLEPEAPWNLYVCCACLLYMLACMKDAGCQKNQRIDPVRGVGPSVYR